MEGLRQTSFLSLKARGSQPHFVTWVGLAAVGQSRTAGGQSRPRGSPNRYPQTLWPGQFWILFLVCPGTLNENDSP